MRWEALNKERLLSTSWFYKKIFLPLNGFKVFFSSFFMQLFTNICGCFCFYICRKLNSIVRLLSWDWNSFLWQHYSCAAQAWPGLLCKHKKRLWIYFSALHSGSKLFCLSSQSLRPAGLTFFVDKLSFCGETAASRVTSFQIYFQ